MTDNRAKSDSRKAWSDRPRGLNAQKAGMVRNVLAVLTVMVCLQAALALAAAAEDSSASPEALLLGLQRKCEDCPSGKDEHGMMRDDLIDLRNELAKHEAAVPLLVKELRNGIPKSDCYRLVLWGALGNCRFPSATEALLEIAFVNPREDWPLQSLDKRTISCDISDAIYDELASIETAKRPWTGTSYPAILAHCVRIPVAKRIAPLLNRFVSIVEEHCAFSSHGEREKATMEERKSKVYLGAFRIIGEEGISAIKEREQGVVGSCQRKWFAIARGMAGDPSAADELKDIILTDTEQGVRVLAVASYAYDLKRESIPFLRTVAENDKRVGWSENGVGTYPLRDEALRVLCDYDRDFVVTFRKEHIPEFYDPLKDEKMMPKEEQDPH